MDLGTRATSLGEPHLVQLAQAGDRGAYGLLYAEYVGLVSHVVRAHVPEPQVVDDAVQEVFTRALERINDLRDADHFRPWLTSIARSVAIDHHRRARRARARGQRDAARADAEGVADERPTPHEMAELRELVELVRGCIRALRPRDAAALTLVAYLGFTPTEVGLALGISPTATKVAMHRSRKRLRTAILAQLLTRHRVVGGCPDLDVEGVLMGDLGALRHLSSCSSCLGHAHRQLLDADA